MNTGNRDKIFIITQGFLKIPPLIIWGSGATIPFGLPSMSDLNELLKKEIDNFDLENDNLESELNKEKYKDEMDKIKKIIWSKVNKADITVLKKIISNKMDQFIGIKLMINKFITAHPEVVNIVTTNYDRVLEYVLSYYDHEYTDGFNGKTLSKFNEGNFKSKNTVNLIKVHGSLNWFDIDDEIRFLPFPEYKIPKIIIPSQKKYEEAYNRPYRELIQKSDNLIKNASNFLVVGFGFNDEHLTPKIQHKIQKGVPIVLITRTASQSSIKELEKAEKYILFEKSKNNGKTKVTYKEKRSEEKREVELEGDLWKLNNFMEIL